VSLLLDTHVLIWWMAESGSLSEGQRGLLAGVSPARPALVSDISLWEIATLCERGRISLSLPVREWLERATAPPFVQRIGISPAVAAQVAALPASFHRDPADRIIVSTAMILGATLLTCDRRIIEAGLVPVRS